MMGLLNRILGRFKNEPEVLYVKSTFDFDTLDKSTRSDEAFLQTMNTGFAVLDKLGIKYSISRGMILGFHRDGAFLPNDVDIDLDIYDDTKVYELIKYMPFELILSATSGGKYMQLAFMDQETQIIFDIVIYHNKGDRYVTRNVYGYFWLPEEKVNNLSSVGYKELVYPALEPEWFCGFWYGENWKTPEKQDPDWSINYRRNCTGFIYTGESNVIYNP